MPPLQPATAALKRPSPWRMAELQERVHALENRQREQALRGVAQTLPPVPASADDAAPG